MGDSNAWDSTMTGPAAAATALAQTLAGEQAGAQTGGATDPAATGAARYELREEIGRGGMGRVVAAHDRQFGRDVAVKQLLAAGDPAARERFAVEALVTGNLEHPGIPAVYERGDGSAPFYAMRRVSGRTLTEALRDARSAEERLRLLPVIVHAAQTVGFAHANGVVHRDLKPDNISIGKHGETFVLDWGIAKVRGVPTTAGDGIASASASAARTQHGSVVGTPAYMAPEQASGKLELIDERTDVFALGALLYHVLAGRAPYTGAGVDDVLERVKRGEHEPLDRAAPAAPPALRAICERAMARDPGDRYASAAELSAAIEEYTADAIAGRGSTAVRWYVNAVSALLAAVFAVGALVMWRGFSPLSHHGPGGYFTIALALLGVSLSAIEFSTLGRYRLSPLILALAGATFLSGVFLFVTGMDNVLASALQRPDQPVVLLGTREAIGPVGAGIGLASLQLLLWALARRRTELRSG